jgi:hypothetical protein
MASSESRRSPGPTGLAGRDPRTTRAHALAVVVRQCVQDSGLQFARSCHPLSTHCNRQRAVASALCIQPVIMGVQAEREREDRQPCDEGVELVAVLQEQAEDEGKARDAHVEHDREERADGEGAVAEQLVFTSTLTRAGTADPTAFRSAMTAALVYEVVIFALALLMVPALPRTRPTRGAETSDTASTVRCVAPAVARPSCTSGAAGTRDGVAAVARAAGLLLRLGHWSDPSRPDPLADSTALGRGTHIELRWTPSTARHSDVDQRSKPGIDLSLLIDLRYPYW